MSAIWIMRPVVFVLLAIQVGVIHGLSRAQSALGAGLEPRLIAKYEKTTLFDVSTDGNLLLVYGARTPRKHKRSQGLCEWKPERDDKSLDILRVIEWRTGTEVAGIRLREPPAAARFTPDGKNVCYQVHEYRKDTNTVREHNNLWHFSDSGETEACREAPEKGAYKGSTEYRSPDGRYVAKTSKETVRTVLLFWVYVRGVVTINNASNGEQLTILPHPEVREPYDWPLTAYIYSLAFTPSNRELITSYEHDTYIWELSGEANK